MLKAKRYPLSLAPRGYYHHADQWKHVYVRETFTQVDIFGDNVDMLIVQFSKATEVRHIIKASDLHEQKPKKPRGERSIS